MRFSLKAMFVAVAAIAVVCGVCRREPLVVELALIGTLLWATCALLVAAAQRLDERGHLLLRILSLIVANGLFLIGVGFWTLVTFGAVNLLVSSF